MGWFSSLRTQLQLNEIILFNPIEKILQQNLGVLFNLRYICIEQKI